MDHLPTQSWLALYSLFANLLHSLMWVIVSSRSRHNLHLFSCVLSILALIWLFFMALFCVAIRRDSIPLLNFPFLSNIFLSEMLLVRRLKRPQSYFPSYFCFLVISVLLILESSVFFWWLWSVFFCTFLCSLKVVVSMRQRCLYCWQFVFVSLFLTHIVCQRHLWDVSPYTWSLVFLFSGPFV